MNWSDPRSKPLDQIEETLWEIKRRTGTWPNEMHMGFGEWRGLTHNPQTIDRLKYFRAGTSIHQAIETLLAPPAADGEQHLLAFRVVVSDELEGLWFRFPAGSRAGQAIDWQLFQGTTKHR